MKALFILVLLLLSGCAGNPPIVGGLTTEIQSPVQTQKIKPTVEIDAYLLEPCEPLDQMIKPVLSFNKVLEYKGKDVTKYNKCADKHDKLINVIKDAFNIEGKMK